MIGQPYVFVHVDVEKTFTSILSGPSDLGGSYTSQRRAFLVFPHRFGGQQDVEVTFSFDGTVSNGSPKFISKKIFKINSH